MKYTIRPCRGIEELAACVALQKSIWGYADYEVYPLRLFVSLGMIGGHVIGAFGAGEGMVGFVAGMPAWHGRRRYIHSLSLGVLPRHQNRGLGRRLKLKQREAAIALGIGCIEWTFDPLRAKNAFFNIVRLGGIACRYLPDHYGHVASRLQQGLPTDRLVCEWRLNSPQVRRALSGDSVRQEGKKPAAVVEIPTQFALVVEGDPAQACKLQASVRRKLMRRFAQGLAITGVEPGKTISRYILDRV